MGKGTPLQRRRFRAALAALAILTVAAPPLAARADNAAAAEADRETVVAGLEAQFQVALIKERRRALRDQLRLPPVAPRRLGLRDRLRRHLQHRDPADHGNLRLRRRRQGRW
jgi:hypothetical protein